MVKQENRDQVNQIYASIELTNQEKARQIRNLVNSKELVTKETVIAQLKLMFRKVQEYMDRPTYSFRIEANFNDCDYEP